MRILIIFFSLMIFESRETYSQIFFNNPSFEENGPCIDCQPNSWYVCYQTPDIYPGAINNYSPAASDGNLYVHLASGPVLQLFWEEIGSKLNCSLTQGGDYYFNIDLRAGTLPTSSPHTAGILDIYGGIDSCGKDFLLWESEPLDSFAWHTYTISFTCPENISTITLSAKTIDIYYSRLFVDNLSPIYCTNFNKVKLNFSSRDTSKLKGECVTLNASASAGYDSIYWKSIPAGLQAVTLNGGEVCPIQNTTYIVAIRDTGCGSFWSYDTLRVEVTTPDEPILYGPENGIIRLISNDKGYLVLYDMLGRIAEIIAIETGEQTIYLGDYNLSAAMYIAQVQTNSQRVNRKLIFMK